MRVRAPDTSCAGGCSAKTAAKTPEEFHAPLRCATRTEAWPMRVKMLPLCEGLTIEESIHPAKQNTILQRGRLLFSAFPG